MRAPARGGRIQRLKKSMSAVLRGGELGLGLRGVDVEVLGPRPALEALGLEPVPEPAPLSRRGGRAQIAARDLEELAPAGVGEVVARGGRELLQPGVGL